MIDTENLGNKLLKIRRSSIFQIAIFSFNISSLFPILLIQLISYINTNDWSYKTYAIICGIIMGVLFLILYSQIIKNAIFLQKNFKSKSTTLVKILSFSPIGSIFVLIFCFIYDAKNNFNYKYDNKYMTILSILSFVTIVPAFFMLLFSATNWNNFINYWYIMLIPVYIYIIILLILIISFNTINWYHTISLKYKILISTLPILFFIIAPIVFSVIIYNVKKTFNDSNIKSRTNKSNNSITVNTNENNYTFKVENNNIQSNKYDLLNQLLEDYKNKRISKEEYEQRKKEMF